MDQKSGGFGRFVSFFIQDEELHKTPAPKNAELGVQQPLSHPPASLSTPTAITEGVVDKKYTEHFEKLLAEANFPGCDYYEFVLALKNMAPLGLPEDKLYQATYATFQALGGHVPVLLETAQQYVQILRDNQGDFEQQVQDKLQHSVGPKARRENPW